MYIIFLWFILDVIIDKKIRLFLYHGYFFNYSKRFVWIIYVVVDVKFLSKINLKRFMCS